MCKKGGFSDKSLCTIRVFRAITLLPEWIVSISCKWIPCCVQRIYRIIGPPKYYTHCWALQCYGALSKRGFWPSLTLQIFKELQVNYRKMMVDVTRKTYYSLVAHQRIVGFSCYSYMKLQVCTVIYYCYYHQTTRVQSGQCGMPLLLRAKYLQWWVLLNFWLWITWIKSLDSLLAILKQ